MSPDNKDRGIKVTDRRMFTAEGELRELEVDRPAAEEAESVARETAAPGPSAEQPGEGSEAEGPEPREAVRLPEPGFADLVSVLAEPIALFLGDVPLPDGKSAENLELARFHIDLLDLLKQKTEVNLSQEELALLEELLYQLRMRYVQKSR